MAKNWTNLPSPLAGEWINKYPCCCMAHPYNRVSASNKKRINYWYAWRWASKIMLHVVTPRGDFGPGIVYCCTILWECLKSLFQDHMKHLDSDLFILHGQKWRSESLDSSVPQATASLGNSPLPPEGYFLLVQACHSPAMSNRGHALHQGSAVDRHKLWQREEKVGVGTEHGPIPSVSLPLNLARPGVWWVWKKPGLILRKCTRLWQPLWRRQDVLQDLCGKD